MATAPVPVRAHVPEGVNVTVPVGVVAPAVEVSVTVAVHEVGWNTTIVEGVQVTTVEVGSIATVIVKAVLLLMACSASPP